MSAPRTSSRARSRPRSKSTAKTAPQSLSGYSAANYSTRRGFIYFPTWDTRRELDSYSRLEMIRRARWLKRNVGFVKRCINGIANMVGYLSPRALTTDKEWNVLAEAAWENRAGTALTFDKQAKYNVYGYQPLLTRSRFLDGDVLSVLTESAGGGAMVMTYESHQVRGGTLSDADYFAWGDGVNANAQGRPLSFSIANPDVQLGSSTVVTVPASDAVLHVDYDSCGFQRGATHLHCAVNHLLDKTELITDLKFGTKIANRIGYYIANQLPSTGKGPPGMGTNQRSVNQKTNMPGGWKMEQVIVEDTGKGGKLLELNAGQEIKQLLDARPHPNSLEFLEWLNRDIAWGLGISSDILWNIAKLGGASVRYVLADAQIFIQAQQQLLVDQFLARFWIYFCAKEMAAGRLRKCLDPEWWASGWTPPARLTVDIGRDGKLSVELHQAGMLTLRRWYDQLGLVLEHELREDVETYALKVRLCAEAQAKYGFPITPDLVWPPSVVSGTVAPPDDPDAGGDGLEDMTVEKLKKAA